MDGDAPMGRDAPGPDSPTVSCGTTSSRTFDVDVISADGYPQPAADGLPLEGASVRVAHACGVAAEGVTDAAGHVTLVVDGPADGWAVTAARAGYSAVSVLDLAGSPVGPLRIDRHTPRAFTAVPISGTVTGATAGSTVLVDAYDFDTQNLTATAGTNAFSTQFYTSTGEPPLTIAALEITGGHLTRLATTTIDPRPHTSPASVELALGAPITPIQTRVTVTIVGDPVFWSILSYYDAVDGPWITPGSVTLVGNVGTFEHDPRLPPTHGFLTWDGPAYRTVVIVHDFPGGDVALAPPTATALGCGTDRATGAFAATGVASGDVDALVLHIDEGEDHGPRWRVYCSPTAHDPSHPCLVPALPSGIDPADLGILVGGVQALAMMQTSHAGALWSAPGTAFPSARLDYQLASTYQVFAVATFTP